MQIKKYNKWVVLIILLLSYMNFYGQKETCESSEDSLIDVNNITKCTIEVNENSKKRKDRQIKVKISASKRYLKNRAPKEKAKSISSISNLNIENVTVIQNIKVDKPVLKKSPDSFKNDVSNLTKVLSKKELSKAKKLYNVEMVPSFDKCRKVKKERRFDCFNNEMIKHINKYFNYPGEAIRNQIQGEVWVRFIIDSEGYIKNIKTLGPEGGKILNEEAIRVVLKLPRFEPAKNKGRYVSVKYGFPINFSLEE